MSANLTCRRIVIATTNPHKLRELKSLLAPLHVEIVGLSEVCSIMPAAPEEADSLADNARGKAISYARRLGECVLSDDTGLFVDALRGAPGVRSARYAGERASMAENRVKLLQELQDVAPADRTACFRCHLAIAHPDGQIVVEATGECRGQMRTEPAGSGGFGYDVLFEVEGLGRTLAELNDEETARFGHRGHAARQLVARWTTRQPAGEATADHR
ncbi:MAG: non-canonical purine NTP pyrophosphatase [Planctomycetaceae bacterium]